MSRERGPWFWILSGCGCLVLVAVLVIAALVWTGARMVRDIADQVDNPQRRRDTAASVLGGELPAGYGAKLAISIPLFGEVVALEENHGDPQAAPDAPPPEWLEPERARRSFLFMRSRLLRGAEGGFDAAQFEAMAGQQGFSLDRRQRLAGGRLELERFAADWSGYRGRFGEAGRERPSTMTLLVVDCPQPDRLTRVGLWIEPLGEGDADALAGTVADEAEIDELLRQLDPCPQGD